jgi:hypothetical protein
VLQIIEVALLQTIIEVAPKMSDKHKCCLLVNSEGITRSDPSLYTLQFLKKPVNHSIEERERIKNK